MDKLRVQSAREKLRRLLEDNPELSILEAARALEKVGQALPVRLITEYRHAFQRTIPEPVIPDLAATMRKPFNPPRVEAVPPVHKPKALVAPRVEVKVVPRPMIVPPPAPPPPEPAELEGFDSEPTPEPTAEPTGYFDSTGDERRTFADQYILDHPMATAPDVDAALRSKFGMTIDGRYVSASLLAIREVTGKSPPHAKLRPNTARAEAWKQRNEGYTAPELPTVKPLLTTPQVPAPNSLQDTLAAAARLLKGALGAYHLKSISVKVDDTGAVDFSSEAATAPTGKMRID